MSHRNAVVKQTSKHPASKHPRSVIFQLPLVQAQTRVDPDSAGSHGVVGGVVSVIVVLAILVVVVGLVHR